MCQSYGQELLVRVLRPLTHPGAVGAITASCFSAAQDAGHWAFFEGMASCRYVMGYVSTVFFLIFTIMMMLLGEEQAKGAHERLTQHEDA